MNMEKSPCEVRVYIGGLGAFVSLVQTYFISEKHDNRIRYKFFNLEHLLFYMYINNIQIQSNLNTQKLQSSLRIKT